MKITKYIHSCLLFQKDGFKILFDPGKFSFAEGLVKPETFNDVDAVIITHIHPDHLDTENLAAIAALSHCSIYTNAEVSAELFKADLESILVEPGELTIGPFQLEAVNVVHELLLDSPAPDMQAYIIDGKVLNPADSFQEELLAYKGIDLLILPVMAPFTTELKIADFADRLRPKAVLPVHDGYAKDFFLQQRYQNYIKHFHKNDILFHQMAAPGDSLAIN